jgi:hypothetical protein
VLPPPSIVTVPLWCIIIWTNLAFIYTKHSVESLGAHKLLKPCQDSSGFLLISLQHSWLAWWAVPQR